MRSDEKATTGKSRRRSGSERRKTQRRMTFRLTEEDYRNLDSLARDAGLTVGSFIRARALGSSQMRQRRRPSVEVAAIARLQAEMNRVGTNIHQILKRVNFGETPLGYEFHDALHGYREVVEAILETLGRKRAA